jgi:hypothetical protein
VYQCIQFNSICTCVETILTLFSSTAYYIKKLIPDAEITIYDKQDRLCGRVLDFRVEGKKVEIGASIYHTINHNVAGFVEEFNLTKAKPFQNDSIMAIWDGNKFVHSESTIPFIGGYVDIANILWRYGLSPIYFKSMCFDPVVCVFSSSPISTDIVATLLSEWEALYELLEPFNTTEELFEKINLHNMTQATAPDFLETLGKLFVIHLPSAPCPTLITSFITLA